MIFGMNVRMKEREAAMTTTMATKKSKVKENKEPNKMEIKS